jgi:putative redox protein
MVEINVKYLGDLRCEAVHGPSGVKIITDAPVDNEGRGESFSPTDLAATSLGACMLTIFGIVARRHEIDPGEVTVNIRKIMTAEPPRRIARLEVLFRIPLPPDHPKRKLLEAASRACPVHLSLHPAVDQNIVFEWIG